MTEWLGRRTRRLLVYVPLRLQNDAFFFPFRKVRSTVSVICEASEPHTPVVCAVR